MTLEVARAQGGSQQSLLELTAILDNASVGILFTRDRIIERCNQRAAEIFGYENGSLLIGQPAMTLHLDARGYDRLGREVGPLLAAGSPISAERELRRADGSGVWCKAYGRAIDPEHTERGTVWVIEDITDARRTADTLKRTLGQMAAIMDNAPVGVIFTKDRRIVRCNAKFAEMFRFAGDSAVGAPGRSIYRSDEDYVALGHVAAPLLSQGLPFQTELLMRRQDGSDIWINLIGYVQDLRHPRDGTIWILEDIGAARQLTETLQQSLRETEAIMANAPIAILFTRDRRIVRANARFAEMFGYQGSGELLGKPARMFYRSDEEYAEIGRKAAPLLSRAQPFKNELFMRRKDGSDVWINLIGYVQNLARTDEGTIWVAEDRTDFKRTEDALQRAYAEQHLILDHSVVGIGFVKDRCFRRVNRRLEEIFGWAAGELQGQRTMALFLSGDSHERLGAAAYAAIARGETFASELIMRRRDGEPLWVRITGKAIDAVDPEGGSIWNFEDISVRKMAEESLRESETLQRAILESASLVILSTDRHGHILSCNPAAERLLGWPAARLLGRRPTELFFDPAEIESYRARLRDETGLEAADPIAALVARAQLGQVEEGEWTFCRADGSRFPVQLSISPLRQHHGEAGGPVKGFLLVAGDITERKQAEAALKRSRDELEVRVKERTSELESEVVQRRRAEQRLSHLALHDSLTGLPNRTLVRQRISQAIEQARTLGHSGAVLFVDLDRFKNINDSLGHPVGDALLKEVARRLASAVRAGDSVARLGGDEFVVVASAIDTPAHATTIADKIRDALKPGIRVAQHELFVTPSIGVALIPRDGNDSATLLRHADTAMYRAKAAGRDAVCFFDPAMTQQTERYLKIESSLRRAIARGEFEPHYQPVVRLADGALVGLELLLRWRDPEHGLVMPSAFIPVAEESGLVAPIGAIVLDAACRQLRAWRAAGLEVPTLAINLSALQFRDRTLIESMLAVMAGHEIPPSAIELEITETALMEDGEKTLATLQWLADAGFALAVDDFGTGYSSLAYLKRFPVSKLKIDRSFILDMTKDPDDEAIVRTIVALAKALRLATTAEGVETAEQRDALARFGCDFAQGYLFARPLPAAELDELLRGVRKVTE